MDDILWVLFGAVIGLLLVVPTATENCELSFNPHDLWIGLFWKTEPVHWNDLVLTVYFCPLPMVVFKLTLLLKGRGG